MQIEIKIVIFKVSLFENHKLYIVQHVEFNIFLKPYVFQAYKMYLKKQHIDIKAYLWYSELVSCCLAVPSHICLSGEMRVQLLNQTLLDLGLYDDGPYEVADQKELNAQLIPVPSHSYLGRICPPCSLLPVHRREREGRRRRMTVGLRPHPQRGELYHRHSGNLTQLSLTGGVKFLF